MSHEEVKYGSQVALLWYFRVIIVHTLASIAIISWLAIKLWGMKKIADSHKDSGLKLLTLYIQGKATIKALKVLAMFAGSTFCGHLCFYYMVRKWQKHVEEMKFDTIQMSDEEN